MTGIKNISINPPKTSIKMDEISNALRSLKMPGMAHYWTAMQETRQHDSLSLKDGLQLLIQAELDNRILSRNARLVKNARFRYKASIGEVIYDSKRGVDKQKVLNLATCDYVRKGVSVLITGAAGTGKSWLGTALVHERIQGGLLQPLPPLRGKSPSRGYPARCTASLPNSHRLTCSYSMTSE